MDAMSYLMGNIEARIALLESYQDDIGERLVRLESLNEKLLGIDTEIIQLLEKWSVQDSNSQ
jgi:hypothetical protein